MGVSIPGVVYEQLDIAVTSIPKNWSEITVQALGPRQWLGKLKVVFSQPFKGYGQRHVFVCGEKPVKVTNTRLIHGDTVISNSVMQPASLYPGDTLELTWTTVASPFRLP